MMKNVLRIIYDIYTCVYIYIYYKTILYVIRRIWGRGGGMQMDSQAQPRPNKDWWALSRTKKD